MRISKAFFSVKAILLGLALAVPALAVNEGAFYEKDHIRGFIGLGGDYRRMHHDYSKYVNHLLFGSGKGFLEQGTEQQAGAEGSTEEVTRRYRSYSYKSLGYSAFDSYYIGAHLNIGAQYRQFMTWIDLNFMPLASCSEGNGRYDACWFNYGADWMFGWKLFGESSIINLIPSLGVGLNVLNLHFTDKFQVIDFQGKLGDVFNGTNGTEISMENRYYSTMSPTFAAELELRLEIDPISIGIFGGYKFVRWNKIDIEGSAYGDYDVKGDTRYIGARITWTFLSPFQNKQRDRL